MDKIQTLFNSVSLEYDVERRAFIPCFDEFYGGATDFVASAIREPNCILDLGAGTGILTQFWFSHFPLAHYTLVDKAGGMLCVAKKRFLGKRNVSFIEADYFCEENFGIPRDGEKIDTVISALSIHHLKDEDKRLLFEKVYKVLERGGVFVNYDQFCADDDTINAQYTRYWTDKILASGLSQEAIAKWRERQKLDKECSVEKEVVAIKSSGFEAVQCIYQNQKFAVIVAKKE